jgi:hypothetical protein
MEKERVPIRTDLATKVNFVKDDRMETEPCTVLPAKLPIAGRFGKVNRDAAIIINVL